MRRIFERSSLIASACVLVACINETASPEDLQLATDGGRAADGVSASDAGLDADTSASPPKQDAATSPLTDADAAAHHDAAASMIARDAAPPATSPAKDASVDAPKPTVDADTPDPGSDPDDPSGPVDASAPLDAGPPIACEDTLSYESFGRGFMATYCTSCHGTKTEPPFTTLAKIEHYKAEIVERVLYEKIDALHMPPYGRPQPSATEGAQLERWLVCGAK